LGLTFITVQALGQSEPKSSEFEHWEGISLSYKVNKKFEISFNTQSRWETDPSSLNVLFLELEPEYELFDDMSISGGYRFSTDIEKNRNRLYLQLEPDTKLTDDLDLDMRLRYDYNWRGSREDKQLRMRMRPEYDFGKTEVFLFAELFLEDGRQREKTRYAIGYQYKFNKSNMVDLRAMVDAEEEENVWIISMVYKVDF
ncbi:MAG: DUF2490 domain-containing protein, partial [Saprospiraceae bacterium]|nr:DUF2490 domain-containing protein [Saprospiraceae bacterium]